MKKIVFIIGAPLSDTNSTFYLGVKADMLLYYYYFLSATGGAFLEYEVKLIENESWEEIQRIFKNNPSDYAVIVFTGHGYMKSDSKLSYFNINEKESISIRSIAENVIARRKLMVLDSCRGIVETERFSQFGDPSEFVFPSHLSNQQARIIHDEALKTTREGIQVLYSCAPGEYSAMDYEGSYYSKSLLNSVRDWGAAIKNYSVLLGQGAYQVSKQHLKKYYQKMIITLQTPVISATSLESNFPFAVRMGSEIQQRILIEKLL